MDLEKINIFIVFGVEYKMGNILTSNSKIQQKLAEAIRKKVYESNGFSRVNKKFDTMLDEVYAVINEGLLNNDTFNSLVNGKLRADFGLDDEKVSILPTLFIDLIEAFYQIQMLGEGDDIYRVEFVIKQREESDPFVQSAFNRAHYVSQRSGELVEWLKWLLFSGTSGVVESFVVRYEVDKGRSKLAFMRKANGQSFSVDPEFAGTENSNMVTKVLAQQKDRILAVFRKHLNVSN